MLVVLLDALASLLVGVQLVLLVVIAWSIAALVTT